ncbi:MAG: flavodoxin domain-containing protein [Chloroflexota bacterium]|nr:flavodoxin domain-containing protein [Chloroflexota bacterium]
MKGIVIFDTSYGNTRTIAETISETLQESGLEVDTAYVKDIKKMSARDCDFLVLGSPTRFGTMSFTVKGLLGKVKSKEWMNKPFVAFDTENPENIERNEGSAAEKIAETLGKKQMIQLLPVLKAVVLGMKGPLQEGEIERAREYAREVAFKLK